MKRNVTLSGVLLVAGFTATLSFVLNRSDASQTPLGNSQLAAYVGQVPNQCCQPGRRFGCDPVNFRQSGCVDINRFRPACFAADSKVMDCKSATCMPATPEDVCAMINRQVRHNTCRPLGRMTTVGCPDDQWQCAIEMIKHTSPNAPTSARMVCLEGQTTICPVNYSVCE